jgi:hypothetical protein
LIDANSQRSYSETAKILETIKDLHYIPARYTSMFAGSFLEFYCQSSLPCGLHLTCFTGIEVMQLAWSARQVFIRGTKPRSEI